MDTKKFPNNDDFAVPLKQLLKLKEISGQNAKVIVSFLSQIAQLYENFANNLQNTVQTFHKEVVKRMGTSAGNFTFCPNIESYLGRIIEANRTFGNNIKFTVITPYLELLDTLNADNNQSIDTMQKLLLNLENSRGQLRKCYENYHKCFDNVNKSQENLDKIARELKPIDQIRKAQEKIIKSKIEANEAEKAYQHQIDQTNQLWSSTYINYKQVFDIYNESEGKKSFFNKNTVINFMKLFDSFYAKEYTRSNPGVQNENYKEVEEKSVLTVDSLQLLTNGSLSFIFENKQLEVFLPYQAKRKIEEVIIVQNEADEGYVPLYDASNENDLHFILDFIHVFTPNEYKNKPSNHAARILSTTNLNLPTPNHTPTPGKKQNSSVLDFPISKENEERIWQVLTNTTNRKFFVDNLVKKKDPSTNRFLQKLPNKIFNYLVEFLRKMVVWIINDKDYETLSSFLPLTVKYYTIKSVEVIYVYEEFQGQKYWEEIGVWLSIVKACFDKRTNPENSGQNRLKKPNETASESSPFVRRVVHFGYQQPTHIFETPKPHDMNKGKDIIYSLIHEIIFYICRLTNNANVTNDLLIQLSKQFEIPKEKIQDLFEQHKQEFVRMLKERIINYRPTKKKRAEKKWGQYYPIYLALDFLNPEDLVKLLELNKDTRKLFERRVFRTVLYNFGDKITLNQRMHIWLKMLRTNEVNLDLKQLAQSFNESLPGTPSTKYKEIIELDVGRSFGSFDQIDKDAIIDILKAYAIHDPEIGYVQGMNYLAGYMYIILRDPIKSFESFVQVMNIYMKKQIYANFKMLKPYWNKLDRMLELYRPKLAAHFHNEKLEAGYYSASWFLTIFVSAFRYKEAPKLLEKVWDFFILDGPDIVFKVALLILMEYEETLIDMSFATILPFLNDIGKEELSLTMRDSNYEEEKSLIEQHPKTVKFIVNFGKIMKNQKGFMQLLDDLSKGLDQFEA